MPLLRFEPGAPQPRPKLFDNLDRSAMDHHPFAGRNIQQINLLKTVNTAIILEVVNNY